ncbi:MAG: iron-sulfur cluster assembly accessory protein [Hyphomicrobiales bacterium]|nr:iron-sulfur cluster assembly accessory protein [Hyphomicrobiales bacterium]
MAALNERPPVLTLTDAAAERIRALLERSETPAAGLRLGVANAGCAGMSYKIDYAEGAQSGDETIEEKGVKIFIDAGAVMFLLGARMDYREGEISSGFVFENPNQVDACGCGESVVLRPAEV